MTDTERKLMRGGLAQITTSNRGRHYEWKGQTYYSVTTIIDGGLPKPALINWAKKFVAEYAVDNIGKLNALLAPEEDGTVDTSAAVSWLKDSPYRDRERKANLGSAVHDYAEAHVLGKPMPSVPLEVKPYLAQFERFLETWKPDYYAVEAPVISQKEGYAGTLDAICEIDHPQLGRTLLDYKTGASGVYADTALQLAAYRYADTFLGLPSGEEAAVPDVDACAVLWIRPDTYELIPMVADESVFSSFLYMREVFRWTREGYKGVKGEPLRNEVTG